MITNPHRVTTRLLLGALTAAAVAAVGFVTPASPTGPAPVALAATSTALEGPHQVQPSFCPFGKARKHGKGCRGGSLVKNKNRDCLKGAAIGAGMGALGGAIPSGGTGAGAGALVGAMGGCAATL